MITLENNLMTSFLKMIKAETAKRVIAPKAKNKEEALKNTILRGIEKQLQYIEFDLREQKAPFAVRRWYQLKEDRQSYYCFIKYQNKPIPFLENNATAYVAYSLEEVKDIYKAIKKEVSDNPEFIKHLDSKIKTMKIAKGIATKKG